MEKKNCSELSNNELKIYMLTLDNEFESKKKHIKEICDDMDKIEKEYKKAEQELNKRKNIYI